tara:strand:+ start:190 stop:477 length:288 start_codon:yes stop_codon:yes gene_type:complete
VVVVEHLVVQHHKISCPVDQVVVVKGKQTPNLIMQEVETHHHHHHHKVMMVVRDQIHKTLMVLVVAAVVPVVLVELVDKLLNGMQVMVVLVLQMT